MAAMIAFFLFGQLWGVSGLVLALPITAILKVLFDNIEGLKAFGFLLGEPEETRSKETAAGRKVRQQVQRLRREVKEVVED